MTLLAAFVAWRNQFLGFREAKVDGENFDEQLY
jgi:hypothetical protein